MTLETRATALVLGSGGREHALGWKLSRSSRVSRLIVAPGGDAWPGDWERWPTDLSKGRPEFEKLARRALEQNVSLCVVGPDNPLADGVVDVFEAAGVPVFGPRAAAARIEASKGFAKEVMTAAGVPTARYQLCRSWDEARDFLTTEPWGEGWVVKADGLALGKGVRVCASREEALEAARELVALSGSLVIEERLTGEELSWLAFSDGEKVALLEPARDYKRVGDGDQGPNTGGMGAFSPVPGVPAGWAERVRGEVFLPTLRELRKRGCEFRGVLYAGLMIDPARDRFWVIEFNARFGDPEAQVLMSRMSDDLYDWCEVVARGDLSALGRRDVGFSRESAVVVVGAARGYPGAVEKGAPVPVLDGSNGEYFFAGVSRKDGKLVASGGRVLGAMGTGPDLASARATAYERLRKAEFPGMLYRRDIGLGAPGRPA